MSLAEKIQEMVNTFETHVGHTIGYMDGDLDNLSWGKLERISVEDIGGYLSIVLWLEAKPFPRKIYFNQVKECSCTQA